MNPIEFHTKQWKIMVSLSSVTISWWFIVPCLYIHRNIYINKNFIWFIHYSQWMSRMESRLNAQYLSFIFQFGEIWFHSLVGFSADQFSFCIFVNSLILKHIWCLSNHYTIFFNAEIVPPLAGEDFLLLDSLSFLPLSFARFHDFCYIAFPCLACKHTVH